MADQKLLDNLTNNIPEELRGGVWYQYYEKRDPEKPNKKPGKIPIGTWAAPADREANGRPLDDLLQKRSKKKHDGYQRFISSDEGLVFLDLDDVRDPASGEIKPWAADIIARLDTYTEVSASGKGFHLVARGTIPADHHRDGDPFEMYAGHGGKLMAMTGDAYELYLVIQSRQTQLDELFQKAKAGHFAAPDPIVMDTLENDWVTRHVPRVDQLPRGDQKWVVDDFLPYAGLAMISGKQGSQKSLLAMYLAQCISGRSACFNRRVLVENASVHVDTGTVLAQRIGAPVLYLDRENPVAEINKRREKLGILGNQNFRYWGDWELEHVPDPRDPRLMQFAKAGGYLIFDSLQQWYGDRNENDNTAMLELMNQFKTLARAGAGVLLLHHNNKPLHKGGDSQSRGGTAIVACTDMAIAASKNDEGIVELREDRFRMCAPWEMDYKVDFNYTHSAYPGQSFYAVGVVRDDDSAAAARFHKQEQESAAEEKRKAKYDEATPERNRLVELIKGDPTKSSATLERETRKNGKGIGRPRIEKLLSEAGFDYQNGRWQQQTEMPEIFDADVESPS
jgi:hypothetical protein